MKLRFQTQQMCWYSAFKVRLISAVNKSQFDFSVGDKKRSDPWFHFIKRLKPEVLRHLMEQSK